jgi:hypothetical protein
LDAICFSNQGFMTDECIEPDSLGNCVPELRLHQGQRVLGDGCQAEPCLAMLSYSP